MSLTYRACKVKIEKKQYNSQEEMQEMLDLFLLGGRITMDEYQELTELLKSNHPTE